MRANEHSERPSGLLKTRLSRVETGPYLILGSHNDSVLHRPFVIWQVNGSKSIAKTVITFGVKTVGIAIMTAIGKVTLGDLRRSGQCV